MQQDEAPPTEGLRVLVVDDNADVAEALSALLELQGCRVEVASHGQQGLELARRFDPRVIFLDIGLPGMNGYEVAQKLCQVPCGPFELVALTGYGQPADREQAREAGFDQHLVKPADVHQIRQILDKVSTS